MKNQFLDWHLRQDFEIVESVCVLLQAHRISPVLVYAKAAKPFAGISILLVIGILRHYGILATSNEQEIMIVGEGISIY